MRAVRFQEYGPASVLKIADVEKPRPLAIEVLVHVRAVGTNPVETLIRSGVARSVFTTITPPSIPGWDISGVVEEIVPGVTRFKVGDEVFGMPFFPRAAGAYAEYLAAPSRQLAFKPRSLDHAHAVALPLARSSQAVRTSLRSRRRGRALHHIGAKFHTDLSIPSLSFGGLAFPAFGGTSGTEVVDMTSTDIPHSAFPNRDRSDLTARLDRVIEDALDDRRIVGTVVLVAKGGQVVYRRAAGFADREAGRSMQEDCIFLLSSVAKPIVTAAGLRLVENGRLGLRDSVRRWLPEFKPRLADGRVPEITIQHLLTHSAGLTYVFIEPDGGPYHRLRISNGFDRTDADLDEIVRRIAAAPLSYDPGAGWGYSMSMDVVGAVIEKVTHRPLPQAVAELVLNPLAIEDTAFAITDPRRLVAHYGDARPEPRRLADDDHVDLFGRPVAFSPVRLLDPKAFPSGGAGMAGTASDVLRFLEALRTGRLLQPQTSSAMFKVQARTSGKAEGPGWEFGYGGAVLVDPKAAGTGQAPGTLQWKGAYGHKWFIDPANELTMVALTNTTFEGFNGQFTIDVRNAVYGN
jgi:CubicO group peptidase (beta-lactamase class C family)